jgi:hypothetical protein
MLGTLQQQQYLICPSTASGPPAAAVASLLLTGNVLHPLLLLVQWHPLLHH